MPTIKHFPLLPLALGLCLIAPLPPQLPPAADASHLTQAPPPAPAAPSPAPAAAPLLVGAALRVNDDAVTSTEVLSPVRDQLADLAARLDPDQFPAQAGPLIARSTADRVRSLLLYQYAKSQLSKNKNFDEAVKSQMEKKRRDVLAQYEGSEARAQVELAHAGATLDDRLEKIKRNLIVAAYQDFYFMPSLQITRSQMLQSYRANLQNKYTHAPRIQFQLIEIQVDKFLPSPRPYPSDQQLDAARAQAENAARAALEKLQLGADFAQVVRQFSHGYRKDTDGLWQPMDPDALQTAYRPVVDALALIQPGQFSPVIPGDRRFFIARLVDRQPASVTPFPAAQNEIDASLREQRWQKYSAKLVNDLLAKAVVGDIEKFIRNLSTLAYDQLRPPPAR